MKAKALLISLALMLSSVPVQADICHQTCHWEFTEFGSEYVCVVTYCEPEYRVIQGWEPDWNIYSSGDVVFAHLTYGIQDSWYVVPNGSMDGPPSSYGTSYETGIVNSNGTVNWIN